MTQPLERRYRRLLLTYPSAYRRERESEMLGTLLEAAGPGQRWPTAREAAALLAGGLRTRVRLGERDPWALWAGALRLTTLLVLGQLAFSGVPALVVAGLLCVVAIARASYALAHVVAVLLVIDQFLPGFHYPVPWMLMTSALWVLPALLLLALKPDESISAAGAAARSPSPEMCSAVMVIPSGGPDAVSASSPEKSARVARIIVAKRFPRGTAIVCRSC